MTTNELQNNAEATGRCGCAPSPRHLPKVEVWEDEDALHLTALLPGVKSDEVQVTLEGDELRISGHAADAAPKGMKLLYSEYEAGDYERVFTLSNRIDRSGICAKVEAGVLRIDFPKAVEAKPVQIPVKVG